MEANELSQTLRELNWSQAELARRIKANKNTVGEWVHGRARVPGSVAAYLALALVLKANGELVK